MMPVADLSIIIVNWNSRDYLRKCLESIRSSATSLTMEIVVIDTASYDGTAEMLYSDFPTVRFIQSDTNCGFAKANNLGAAGAGGRGVLFLNPDTELVDSALDVLYDALMTTPGAGAVGGRLLNTDGSLQDSCIQAMPTIANQVLDANALRRLWPRSPLWGMRALHEPHHGPVEVEVISGACVMVKRDVFEAVGGFSEEYFMYSEDVDLAHKVRRRGYRNLFVPGASIVHHGGSSSSRSTSLFAAVMMPEATFRFLKKTRGPLYGWGYRGAIGLAAVGRLGMLTLRPSTRLEASMAKWKAIAKWSLRRDGIVDRYYSQA